MNKRITALILVSAGLLAIAWQIVLVIADWIGICWEKYSRPPRE